MPVTETMSARVVDLETLVTHLQHDLDQLNAVILAQQSEIGALRTQVEELEGRLNLLDEEPEEPGAATERPPHY